LFDDRTQKSLDTVVWFGSKTDGLILAVVDQICNACSKVTIVDVIVLVFRAKMLKKHLLYQSWLSQKL
jgi:hypothetical protein